MDKLLFCLLICCAGVSCQADLCGESLDTCYEEEVLDILQNVTNQFHSDIVGLCTNLRSAGLTRCASTSTTCQATNPWQVPAGAFIEALCLDENIRQFSAPLVPADQCFHINFTFECIARRVDNYNTLTEFIRSHKNVETCKRLIGSVNDCIMGTYSGCPNPQRLKQMQQALLAVANHTLTVTGCDVKALSDGADRMAQQGACEAQLTRVKDCVESIISPNTVANHLLEKTRLPHESSSDEFCRDYKTILDCKRDITKGPCFTPVGRSALERNLNAFSKARDYLCDDNAKNLRAYKDARTLSSQDCVLDDEAIDACSKEFVQSVTKTDASEHSVNRAFKDQVACIRRVVGTCKAAALQNIITSFIDTAASAFAAGSTSDATRQTSVYPVLTLLVATGLTSIRY